MLESIATYSEQVWEMTKQNQEKLRALKIGFCGYAAVDLLYMTMNKVRILGKGWE